METCTTSEMYCAVRFKTDYLTYLEVGQSTFGCAYHIFGEIRWTHRYNIFLESATVDRMYERVQCGCVKIVS